MNKKTSESPEVYILLLSGGRGERFSSFEPKQFSLLKNKPLLTYSLETFWHWEKTKEIYLVVPNLYFERSQSIATEFSQKNHKNIPIHVLSGGKTRHLSCLRGLELVLENCRKNDIIFFHDVARPFIQACEMERLYKSFIENTKYLIVSLALDMQETIVEADGWNEDVIQGLDRNRLYAMKTPQAAKAKMLTEMIEKSQKEKRDDFTDLISWSQYLGVKSTLVKAENSNQKITTKNDLSFLKVFSPDMKLENKN